MAWGGLVWTGVGRLGLPWAGLGWFWGGFLLGWSGLVWACLGWPGVAWTGLGCPLVSFGVALGGLGWIWVVSNCFGLLDFVLVVSGWLGVERVV